MAAPGGGEKPESPQLDAPASSAAPEAHEAPHLAEQRYRALVRNFPNSAIILCDPDLRLVLVDGPEVAATGFSKEAMEGKTIYETLPPDFVKLVEGNLRRVLAGETFSAEIPFGHRHYLYQYVPIRDELGAVVYALILAQNVTGRRRAELDLRRSEERFAKIFHASPEAISVLRLSDGVIVDVNPAFEQTFGYSRSELIGKSNRDLRLWVDPRQRERLLDMLRRDGRVDGMEAQVWKRDGRLLDGVISLRPIAEEGEELLFAVFRDVSDRVRFERALVASEARYRALAEATFEGIGISDRGVIVDVNDQLARMLGYERSALIGKPVMTLVAPESIELVRTKMAAGTEEPYEHLSIRTDGTRFPVEVRGRMAVIAGNTVRIAAVRDISQRKLAEAERERLINELRARNAEMEQFAYTVSHDLKSPLVTINGFLGMLERDLAEGDTDRVRADVARIASAASKMMRLLNDLLELSRIGRVTLPPTRVSLSDVVHEAIELVSFAIAERKVRVTIQEGLPDVYGDRVRLVQVVQNLVENAVKYMGNQSDPRIEIGVRPDPDKVICFVRDNGIGVKPAYSERIFGLFEKLDPKSEGTGVGLALVRRILDFHGGGVSVESDGKSGSTFVFHLPSEQVSTERRESQ